MTTTSSATRAAVSASSGSGSTPTRGEASGWQWRTSKTGSWLRPTARVNATLAATTTLCRACPGPGRVTVVVDPTDDAGLAREIGTACRRRGRFVVHTSPRQRGLWRMQLEVLRALGKHGDRPGQEAQVRIEDLATAWLRAERARELVVLRAQHLTGPALAWVVGLAAQEGLHVWLISPCELPDVDHLVNNVEHIDVARTEHRHRLGVSESGRHGCSGCEDLNDDVDAVPDNSRRHRGGLTVAVARRLRLLYDMEAAGLATTALLLDCPHPDVLATARPQVTRGARAVTTARGRQRTVPEHARGLLRAWAGQALWPEQWADDVAATYLTLRLEVAEHHSGVTLLDPHLPLLPPVAWHERTDPGAALLSWMTPVSRAHGEADHHPAAIRPGHSRLTFASTLTCCRDALSSHCRSTLV